jgi:hypothetical protein|tara:strand:+ start:528 stop:935 length:408 start_codon:yes stop_codon:yes gene_type:complete
MSTFDQQITTARAKAQWDIWKDSIIQMQLDLSKTMAEVYLTNGTVRKKKEIELASRLISLYSLLRSKLTGAVKFPKKKDFIHLLELDKLDPDKPIDINKLRAWCVDIFGMVDALGYTRVEEVQHEQLTARDFANR